MKFIYMLSFFLILFSSCSSDEMGSKRKEYKVYDYLYSSSELELLQMINDYRESIGLTKLNTINHLSHMSFLHNSYMIEKNNMSHDFFQNRSDEIISLFKANKVGENLAYNFNTNKSVLNAWLNSIGHKSKLEGDYTHFGLSITIDPVSGRKFYTNIFLKMVSK